jgi:hypothetical protein
MVKNTLMILAGIAALLVLANINNIIAAVAPEWFACLWGLCR